MILRWWWWANTLELTRRDLRKIKSKGLSEHRKKTWVVLFTRRKKTKKVVIPEHQGVKLILTKEGKYLGVTLDGKLMWKTYTENQVK